jgi:glycosyltransferase involved in cell wall biosynthesis
VSADSTSPRRVSVVIPCFNHARYLGEAIDSVLSQRCDRLEVVVVNDGSTDDTASVAASFPVRLVSQTNQGLAAARNTGLAANAHEYVLFLDADDRLVPGAIEYQRTLLDSHPTWAFVSGEHRYIDEQGQVCEEWSGPGVSNDHYKAMLRKNYIGCCDAVMFRREALQAVGGFDTAFRACEDYDLYLRLTRAYPVGTHSRLIADYRRYSSSMSGDPGRMLRWALRALGKQRPLVKRDPELAAAHAEGVAFWRHYYGPALVRQTREDLRARHRRVKGLRNLLCLARYAPGEVGALFADPRTAR